MECNWSWFTYRLFVQPFEKLRQIIHDSYSKVLMALTEYTYIRTFR